MDTSAEFESFVTEPQKNIQKRWPDDVDCARIEALSGPVEITAAAVTAAIFPSPDGDENAMLFTAAELHELGAACLVLAARLRGRKGDVLGGVWSRRLETKPPCTCGTKMEVDDCEAHPFGPVKTLRRGIVTKEPEPYWPEED